MSWLSNFLHPGRAYDKAAQQYQAGQDRARGLQQPFIGAGQDALGELQQSLGSLLNPQQLQSEWAQGYEQSPYATDLLQRNQQSGLDAASAQGLMGSSAALENIQRGAGQIQSQDRQQYMQDLMQKYLTGIQGLQGIFGTGAGMAGQAAGQEIQGGNILGGLAAGQNQAGANMFGQGAGLLGSLLGGALTGGMGGIAGLLGGGLGSDMFGGG